MIAFKQRLDGAGIRRPPWLTLTVFAATAVPSCVQGAVPALLHDLERTPAGLTDEWWRSLTSLLVQDGGVLGTLSNLAFLLVIGLIAEQVVSRPRWLALYLIPALAGELAGYGWQPVGAGNSVAVCGLSGALAVLMLRDRRPAPAVAPYAQLLWTGALAGTVSPIAAGLILAGTGPLLRLAAARRIPAAVVAGAAVLACGVALVADQNIHGAALLAGALLGAAITSPGRAAASTSANGATSAPSSPAAAGAGAPAVAACTTTDLKVSTGNGGGGAAGSFYSFIDFTNTSAAACTLYGYPGVSLTASSGGQLGAAATRSTTTAAKPVTLAPGATANASLRTTDPTVYPTGRCQPATSAYLKVYPPDQTQAAQISYTGTTCANTAIKMLSIGVVTPGTLPAS